MPTTTQTPPVTQQVSTETVKPAIIVGKFNGTFCQFQINAFWTLVHGGISKKTAHKVCVDYGSDFGRLMASNAEFASKIGKAKKNGESKISISGGGYVLTSRSMSIVRACQQVDNLYMEGLLAERALPSLTKKLQEYLVECETWAGEQNWETK